MLASVLQVCIYCKVLSWLHHEGLHSCCHCHHNNTSLYGMFGILVGLEYRLNYGCV